MADVLHEEIFSSLNFRSNHVQEWGAVAPPPPAPPSPTPLVYYRPLFHSPIGRGAISGIQVSLTSFQSDPPNFNLLGATSGGPPTTYTWTRNGQVITNNASYSISIEVERSIEGFQNSRYRNTLTVTGRLPGVYQYSVTNRATSGMVTDTFTIESKYHMLLKLEGIQGGSVHAWE